MIGPAVCAVLILASPPEISPRVPAAYEIKAYLDDSTHTVTGSEKVTFVNPTSRALDTVAFHLYFNAFRDTSTVFCREDASVRKMVERGNVSRIDVTDIMVGKRSVRENEYRIDGTRMYIGLERPLPPGSTIEFRFNFEILIPEMVGHFGYDSGGEYLIAHAFPILCGYQKDRLVDWEYHSTSEFFSNFSYYDVAIELPRDFKAVSTGRLSLESQTDSTAVWRALADTVIDFAMVCGAGLLEYESEFEGVTLKYLIKEKNKDYFAAIDSTVKNSLGFCGELLYPYPYGNFSFSDAGFTSAGLELPGLIVCGFHGSGDDFSMSFLKKTIAHEAAHQWFYATIATNEFEEPWLDEGFASFLEFEIAGRYGFDTFPYLYPNYMVTDRYMKRFFALLAGARYPINLRSWDYPDQQSYFTTIYGRGWMVLQALQSAMGDSAFANSIAIFARDYRFKHPDGGDFINSVSRSYSGDISRFAEMFIDGTSRVDYAVERLRYEESDVPDDSGKVIYKVYVEVARMQDGVLPQIVTVGLKDGSILERSWDGEGRVEQMEFETGSIPVYASVDRAVSYEIDEDFNNNTIYLQGHVTRMISFEWDFIFLIELLASLIL